MALVSMSLIIILALATRKTKLCLVRLEIAL